ncbi:MAG: hypothetical protein IJF26_00305 [Clostridia bacterium]|nr:hypothetical protein [Clostridia bacterium]
MKKAILTVMVMLFACVLLTACSDYDEDYVYDGSALVGKWQEIEFDEGFYKVYDFKADGTVTYTYCIYGMICDTEYGMTTQKYRVDDTNTLVIIGNYNGKEVESKINFSISEDDKKLVMVENGEVINKLEPYKLPYDEVSPLMGKWISVNVVDGRTQTDLFWFSENNECFIFPNVSGKIGDDVDEFKKDYINSEVGFIQTMLYSTAKEKIYICFADEAIISEESVLEGKYEIKDGKLIISSDGEAVVELTRLDDDAV